MCTFIIMLGVLNNNSFKTYAHCLTSWSIQYPASGANSTNSFGICDAYHIKGRTGYYKWDNSTVRNYFNDALLAGESAWGDMIDIIEDNGQACFTIKYNPNIASGAAAETIVYGPSYGHYSSDEIQTEVVIGDIVNYSFDNKKKVLTHELGHLWGIEDLYGYYTNLNSIYSNTYAYDYPTRHDKNAMYICQDRPWYYDSNNNLKFLKAPGQFASNEWVYSHGYQPTSHDFVTYYIGGNGVLVNNAASQERKSFNAYSVGSTLYSGQTLYKNRYLSSNNKKFIALMGNDGNFAVYNSDSVLWSAGTNASGTGDRRLVVQGDGNIVIYDANGVALWSLWGQSGTYPNQAYKLVMQDDGNLVAYKSNGVPIWSIGVHTGGIKTFYVANESDMNSAIDIIDGATCIGNTLYVDQIMSINQFLESNNHKFIAKMQSDGNFVVYNSDGEIWSAGSSGNNAKLEVQSDGNITIKDSNNQLLWNIWGYAGVNGHEAYRIVMQDDGNLVAYDSNGSAIWWSRTQTAYGAGTFEVIQKAIKSKFSGLYLYPTSDNRVVQSNTKYIWNLKRTSDNKFYIMNQQNTLVVNITGVYDGADLQMSVFNPSNYQAWSSTEISGGFSRLIPESNSSYTMDIEGPSYLPNATIQIWTYATGVDQFLWKFENPD